MDIWNIYFSFQTDKYYEKNEKPRFLLFYNPNIVICTKYNDFIVAAIPLGRIYKIVKTIYIE